MKYIVYIELEGERGEYKITETDSFAYVQALIDQLKNCSEIISISIELEKE